MPDRFSTGVWVCVMVHNNVIVAHLQARTFGCSSSQSSSSRCAAAAIDGHGRRYIAGRPGMRRVRRGDGDGDYEVVTRYLTVYNGEKYR